jgi:hypothetical protein
MSLRLIAALGCWALGIGTSIGVFALLNLLEPAAWVAIGAVATWFALMLAAYVLNSRGLMVIALWSVPALTLLSIPLGIALTD